MTNKKRVLIFPCGSEIGLEINRALANDIHFELFGASSLPDHGKFVYKNYIEGIPYVEDNNFISTINNICEEYSIDFIIPAHDSVVLKLAQNAEKLKAKVITSPLETCEIALFFYLVNGCFFKVFKDTLSVILFAVLILISLFILNKGYISRFLNNHIILKFGKYAFSIYIMQQVSHALTKNYILKHIELLTMHPILTIWGSLFFSILLGVITYHLIENPSANYLKKNLLDKYDYYFAQRERERESKINI